MLGCGSGQLNKEETGASPNGVPFNNNHSLSAPEPFEYSNAIAQELRGRRDETHR